MSQSHNLRTLGFEGISPLCPPLPSRAVKLSFSTSPKTLSLKFVLAPVNREAELLASVFLNLFGSFYQNLSQLCIHPVIFSPIQFLCIFFLRARYARCKLKHWSTGPRSQLVAIWMLQNSLFQYNWCTYSSFIMFSITNNSVLTFLFIYMQIS